MSSLQFLQALQHGSSFSTSRRKALLVAASTLVAGGGLAYARYILCSRNLQQDHVDLNAFDTEKDSTRQSAGNNSFSKSRQKYCELKSLQVLSGILLAQMGRKGMQNLLSMAVIAVLKTILSNRLAKVQGLLFRAAFLRRVPLFMRLITENLLLCLLQSVFLSTTKYLTGSLSLHFRKILTDHIHADYFQNMSYYKMSHVDGRISNPEQRIASDIPRFCSELSDLIQEDLTAVTDAVLYTWRLCSYASPKYVLWILAYVIGAGFITGSLSPPFGKLMSKEQQLEGDYRQLHARLRTHAESIAFYGGQDREASFVQWRFKTLVKHMSVVLHTHWWFGMIQDLLLKYLGATVGLILIIEPFFSGNLKPDKSTLGRAEMLSNMRYHTSVIISLFYAMGTVSISTRRLNRLSGYADRIRELMIVARELRVAGGSHTIQNMESRSYFTEANCIEFEGVKVVTPKGNTLVDGLTLKVEPGSNLLITGPNGSGKSSLFRVLGGLWPLAAGHIAKPGMGSDLNKEIFYVPQKPYTAVGTLHDQLIYPLTASETEPLTKEGLHELLKNVDLEYLLDRYPLEEEINWGDELSLGEQQRLGMARLFYHKPNFAILDECTSAVTMDMEERFCAKVRAMGTSCITISHRPALVAFHDTVLSLDGEGGWDIHYKRDSASLLKNTDDESGVEGIKTGRQNDAWTVQRAFASTKEEIIYHDVKSNDFYVGALLAKSPPQDADETIHLFPRLKNKPRNMPGRVSALMRILVPTLFDKQSAKLFAVTLLVVSRTWISDRIASLSGKNNILNEL
eukprot:Gb_29022 [translate_table: standard]